MTPISTHVNQSTNNQPCTDSTVKPSRRTHWASTTTLHHGRICTIQQNSINIYTIYIYTNYISTFLEIGTVICRTINGTKKGTYIPAV